MEKKNYFIVGVLMAVVIGAGFLTKDEFRVVKTDLTAYDDEEDYEEEEEEVNEYDYPIYEMISPEEGETVNGKKSVKFEWELDDLGYNHIKTDICFHERADEYNFICVSAGKKDYKKITKSTWGKISRTIKANSDQKIDPKNIELMWSMEGLFGDEDDVYQQFLSVSEYRDIDVKL